jgi:hypothetical protein
MDYCERVKFTIIRQVKKDRFQQKVMGIPALLERPLLLISDHYLEF